MRAPVYSPRKVSPKNCVPHDLHWLKVTNERVGEWYRLGRLVGDNAGHMKVPDLSLFINLTLVGMLARRKLCTGL